MKPRRQAKLQRISPNPLVKRERDGRPRSSVLLWVEPRLFMDLLLFRDHRGDCQCRGRVWGELRGIWQGFL